MESYRNSDIYQSGTNIGIGLTTPSEKLNLNGNLKLGDNTYWTTTANDRLAKFGDGDFVTVGESYGDDVMGLKAKIGKCF